MKVYILVLLILLSACPVFCATFTVNNNGDTVDAIPGDGICSDAFGNCTLRAAIREANQSSNTDEITFSLSTPNTISLTLGELAINNNLTISGLGATALEIQRSSSASSFSVFAIGSDMGLVTVSLNQMTIANGSNSGIRNIGATLNFNNVIIRNNGARFGGG